jgi:hypothetical protein
MEDQNNILQFPKPQPSTPTSTEKPRPKKKASVKSYVPLATTVCSLLAISLAAATSNSAFFAKSDDQKDLSSVVDARSVASVEQVLDRDASWEKSMAENLASVELRDVASVSVGHEASLDENLRYGVLERKYTILRDLKRNEVESIILQGAGSEPTMLRDRANFLGKYGKWMSERYSSSEFASKASEKDKNIESFTIYDSQHKAYATARFELDNMQRLLAFHFEPLL